MGLFNRKKKKEVPAVESPVFISAHEHTWKDMPWYMGVHYSGTNKTAGYKIVEPYICVTCGKRKDITLEEEDYSNINAEDREVIFNRVRECYKDYLKPRAIVEDMINNIILVKDPQRLEMLEKMLGSPHKNVGSSAQNQKACEEEKAKSEFRIILPPRST